MDIYVGNLPYSATEDELGDLFAAFGPVKRVTIIKDRETGLLVPNPWKLFWKWASDNVRLFRSEENRE